VYIVREGVRARNIGQKVKSTSELLRECAYEKDKNSGARKRRRAKTGERGGGGLKVEGGG